MTNSLRVIGLADQCVGRRCFAETGDVEVAELIGVSAYFRETFLYTMVSEGSFSSL